MLKITEFQTLTFIAILCARIIPYRIFSIFPIMYAFISRTRSNPTDRRNYIVLSLIFILHNSLIIYVVCILFDIRCILRYVFLAPLIPLHFFNNKRSTCPINTFSLNLIIIRVLWDPPIMFTSYILYNFFGIRLLHDGMNLFATPVTKQILISSYPFHADIQPLYDNDRVRAVVNMCAEYKGPIDEYSRLHITHLRLPTIDGSIPQLADIKKGVEFIENRLQVLDRDKTILVHCKGGRGRAATIVICYLIKHENMSVEDAFEMLYKRRPVLEKSIINYGIYDDFLN